MDKIWAKKMWNSDKKKGLDNEKEKLTTKIGISIKPIKPIYLQMTFIFILAWQGWLSLGNSSKTDSPENSLCVIFSGKLFTFINNLIDCYQMSNPSDIQWFKLNSCEGNHLYFMIESLKNNSNNNNNTG